MHTNLPARLRLTANPAIRSGIANAALTLATTGLTLAAASLRRRRRLARLVEERTDVEQRAYEHFVRAFGTASELSDTQLAALTTYLSSRADRYVPTVVAELLRGRAWNWRDENDDLDEDEPRVQYVTAVVDGLDDGHPYAADLAAATTPITEIPWGIRTCQREATARG